jgi:hypothetical protein
MTDNRLDSRAVSISDSSPAKPENGQPEQHHGLLSTFGGQFLQSIKQPLTGAEQLAGNQSAADNYFKASDTSSLSGSDS